MNVNLKNILHLIMFIIVAFNALGCPNIPYISGPINIDHRKKQLINSLNPRLFNRNHLSVSKRPTKIV